MGGLESLDRLYGKLEAYPAMDRSALADYMNAIEIELEERYILRSQADPVPSGPAAVGTCAGCAYARMEHHTGDDRRVCWVSGVYGEAVPDDGFCWRWVRFGGEA